MNEQSRTLNFGLLAKRFALPAVAVWLMYVGISIIIFMLAIPIMSSLSRSINWFLDEFHGGNGTIVETYWMIKYTATEAAEGAILIVLGILVGAWVLRRQKKKALA